MPSFVYGFVAFVLAFIFALTGWLTEMFVDTQSALRLFMVGSIKMPTGRIRIRLNLLLTASSCVYMTA